MRHTDMSDNRLSLLSNSPTWAGALISGAAALTLNEWLAIGGFILALFGTILNAVLQLARHRMARREHEARLKATAETLPG